MKRAAFVLLALGCATAGGADSDSDAERVDAQVAPRADAPTAAPDASADTGTRIQEIQDGTLLLDQAVTVEKVFVTAVHRAPSGNVTVVVQEPQDETIAGHTYPEYAAVAVFFLAADAPAPLPAVGDCLNVTGTIDEYYEVTQLIMSTLSPASGCSTPPAPFAVTSSTFGLLATDRDPSVAADQPGDMSELYEGVLIRLSSVKAPSGGPDGYGETPLVEQANGTVYPHIDLSPFMHDYGTIAPGTSYTVVTGIYTELSGHYKVQPRSGADLTP